MFEYYVREELKTNNEIHGRNSHEKRTPLSKTRCEEYYSKEGDRDDIQYC
jgi:hypothetical protein